MTADAVALAELRRLTAENKSLVGKHESNRQQIAALDADTTQIRTQLDANAASISKLFQELIGTVERPYFL